MACGEYGEGRMSSPRQILSYLKNYFNNKDTVKKEKISAVVTSGPTKEYIDPVRFISNESSGKQGYEIALALVKLGVKTTLITVASKFDPCKGLKIKEIPFIQKKDDDFGLSKSAPNLVKFFYLGFTTLF